MRKPASCRRDRRPARPTIRTRSAGSRPAPIPTEQAKLEATLPKFQAAADAYPSSEAGITARYHLAKNLVTLGRFDDAIKAYDQVLASGNALLARSARLGKAEAQLRAGQYDPAIATLKQIVDQKDAALPAEAVLMELARAYKLAGKTEDARKTLTLIVEQHAETQYATEAQSRDRTAQRLGPPMAGRRRHRSQRCADRVSAW